MKTINTNKVLLGAIIILLIIVAVILFNNKVTNKPINQEPNIEDNTNNNNPILDQTKQKVPEKDSTNKSTLVIAKSDPYPKSNSPFVGGASYKLVLKPISIDNTMRYFSIYTNSANGQPFSKEGTVFYNSSEQNQIVKFGTKATGDTNSFREKVNLQITNNGYAIVSEFIDGGPDYVGFDVVLK